MTQRVKSETKLTFRFYVPAYVEIVMAGEDRVSAAKNLASDLESGAGVLYVRKISDFTFLTTNSADWRADLQWRCPDCGLLQWFGLNQRDCFGYCPSCNQSYVVVEGVAFRNYSKGCGICPKKLECMLIPRIGHTEVECEP